MYKRWKVLDYSFTHPFMKTSTVSIKAFSQSVVDRVGVMYTDLPPIVLYNK